MTAWDYVDGKRYMYVYSDVKKRMSNAFTITQAAEILNRHRMTIDGYIRDGHVRTPQRKYNLFTKKPGMYLLSVDDILDIHAYMQTQHYGRPRNDGLITNLAMPSINEVRALVKHGEVLYTEDAEGNLIPVWKERLW